MVTQITSILCIGVALILTGGNLYAYGGGGSSSSHKCRPAILNKTSPEKLAVVQQGDGFSFVINNVQKNSISVIIKKTAALLEITQTAPGRYRVDGKIPAEAPNGYARINVHSKTLSNCASSSGWLVIIGSADS